MVRRFLTSREVAELVRASPTAVLRWIDQGELRAFRTPGGHRRVQSQELVAFLKSRNMPVPEELEARLLRVLAVDDQAEYLASLAVLLERTDARLSVSLVDNPVDALVKVGLWRPDVVLLDAYMPGMDGLEVCRRLKATAETANIAVVAMSGRASDELEAAFKKAGAAAFLEKPLTAGAILEVLASVGLLAVRPPQGGGGRGRAR